jgi:hypothetical protein
MSTNEEKTNESNDTERLRFLMQHGPEGFYGVPKDRYDYACEVAMDRGCGLPSIDDELNGYRRMIDEAMILLANMPLRSAYSELCAVLRENGLPTKPSELAIELKRWPKTSRPEVEMFLFGGMNLNDREAAADLREACAAVRASRHIAATWMAHAPSYSRLKACIDILLRPHSMADLIRALCRRAGIVVSSDPNDRRVDLLIFHVSGHDGIVWERDLRSYRVSTADAAAIVSALSELPPNAGLAYVLKVFRSFAS